MSILDRFRSAERRAGLQAEREKAAAEHELRAAETAERERKESIARRIREEERLANAKWEYREIEDEMRGTTMSMAQTVSENTVDMLPPYHGGTQAILAVRLKNNRLEVVVTFTNGQLNIETGRSYKIAYKSLIRN